MLGVLRDEPETRAGEPCLQDVGELLTKMRAAGLPVTLTISGDLFLYLQTVKTHVSNVLTKLERSAHTPL